MQFSIVDVASFWAAIHFSIKFGSENTNDLGPAWQNITGNHRIHLNATQPFLVSSRNTRPHKKLLRIEPHSFPFVFAV